VEEVKSREGFDEGCEDEESGSEGGVAGEGEGPVCKRSNRRMDETGMS